MIRTDFVAIYPMVQLLLAPVSSKVVKNGAQIRVSVPKRYNFSLVSVPKRYNFQRMKAMQDQPVYKKGMEISAMLEAETLYNTPLSSPISLFDLIWRTWYECGAGTKSVDFGLISHLLQ